MKKNIIYRISGIILFLVSVVAVHAQNTYNEQIKVISADLKQEGNLLHISMQLDLQNLNINKQSDMVLTPVLIGEENSVELPSILIYGKTRYKAHKRSMALKKNQPNIQNGAYKVIRVNNKDSEKVISYSEKLPHEEWMKNSHLIIKGDLCGCGNLQQLANIRVTEIATYEFQPELAYIQPEFEAVKTRHEDTEVFIDFKVNQAVIDPDLMNNQIELAKLDNAFKEIKDDENLTVESIEIMGYASPEGSVANNETLSKKRAEELKKYLSSQAYFPDDLYLVDFGGENWDGLEYMVKASDMDSKSEVLSIIQNTPEVDVRKNKLKSLEKGKPYNYMLANFYPKLRKTVTRIHYNIRNFNVAEGKVILNSRPEQLSQNEMFQIANSYSKGSDEFVNVFNVAAKLYPDNSVTNLNAGAAALSNGDLNNAEKYLSKTDKNTPEYYNNMGVYSLMKGDIATAKEYFGKAANNGNTIAKKNLEELDNKIEIEGLDF